MKIKETKIKVCLVCNLNKADVKAYLKWVLDKEGDVDNFPCIEEEMLEHLDYDGPHNKDIAKLKRSLEKFKKDLVKGML